MKVRHTILTKEILKAAKRDELTRDNAAALVFELGTIGHCLNHELELPAVACLFFKSALEIHRAEVVV